MNNRKSIATLLFSLLIFGSIGVVRKYIQMPSGLLSCIRGVVGSLLVLLYLFISKHQFKDKFSKKNLIRIIIAGVLIGAQWVLLFEAYRLTSVSVAVLCYYLAPTFVVLLSSVLLKEKFSIKKLICCLISVFGMLLVSGVLDNSSSKGTNDILGIALALAGAFFYAIVVIINKKNDHPDALVTTVVQIFSAGVAMIPYVLISEIDDIKVLTVEPLTVLLVIVMCVFQTGVSYSLYFKAYQGIQGQTLAILSYLDPVSSLFYSAIFLAEIPTVFGIFGAILIIGASIVSEIDFKSIKSKTNV